MCTPDKKPGRNKKTPGFIKNSTRGAFPFFVCTYEKTEKTLPDKTISILPPLLSPTNFSKKSFDLKFYTYDMYV